MSRRPPSFRGTGDALGGSSARGIALLAVAVLLGVFILNQTDPGSSASQSTEELEDVTTTTISANGVNTLVPTTAPRPARPPAEVKVLPANGSGVAGLGGRVGDRLKARGYTNTLAATNTTREVSASSVEFNRDFEPEARAVAEALGLPPTVVKALDSPPVADTRGADVVVLIGPDLNTGGTTTTSGRGTTTTRAGATTTTRR
ncbi:MAG TPA: LytR C-terminal domain-containing protein [Acidimicrobiales bacterium]|nr:LytR C-terminal domain-containing protein [Acidimicrobiales bacterium]